MRKDIAVQANGLVKRYGKREVLHGVDLTVPKGSVTAILGPNGAGKTVTVRILATLTGPPLILLMGCAFRWIGTMIGFLFPPGTSFRVAQVGMLAGFMSNAFVPTDAMTPWLRTVIEWNPISALITATRTLFGTPVTEGTSLPLQHPIATTIAWDLVLLAVCIPVTLAQRAHREV